ncbi:MAG: patatin-like protein [Gammaproteobacteria bacterium]|nr:patatin-like protein [Gammaproteobacteria bacterium]
MSKKELRLAVVIYGGASLAIYMHGVTKELLKLVRASKVLHEMGRDRAARSSFTEGPDHRDLDTEAVYFELLKQINADSHFRVVLDVIAGASAGAINGVMLAKAIVDDSSLDGQTPTWLSDADVEYMGRETSPWKKWYLYPLLRLLFFWLPRDIGANSETREKLARVVRSSWFRPPLSGARLSHIFFDALERMRKTRREGSTLLPQGQRLDVYASITDLAGYPRTIRLHDELMARENEHAAYCRLSHVETDDGRRVTDFDDANTPALVWAGRASSSYAGAFEPFHNSEMRGVLRAREQDWPGEQKFLHYNVFVEDGTPAARLFDPANRYFVDGGIVNNKPFAAALEALSHRPADRHVERCIAYIEPDPNVDEVIHPERNLGYLSTIRAALSTIPRNQPIVDDLNDIVAQDNRVRINRRIVDANSDHIHDLVAELQGVHARQALTTDLVTYLRTAIIERAEEQMGIAYHAYVQRRVWRLTEALVVEWSVLAEDPNDDGTRQSMSQSVSQWWQGAGVRDSHTRDNLQESFLDRFDVTFRIRRLQFVIRRINQHEDVTLLDERSGEALDSFKHDAYGFLERLHRLRRSQYLNDELVNKLAYAAGRLPLDTEGARELLKSIFDALGLQAFDREFDRAFCEFLDELQDEGLKNAMMTDYVGFPIYDVLLMSPAALEGGPDPLTPIRVERISPSDASSLTSVFDGLKCRDFMGFLGFFNRAYREHDYLWGRLNAADRVVDLLVKTAGDSITDAPGLRRRLFRSIVDTERRRLYRCDEQLDRIDALLKESGA